MIAHIPVKMENGSTSSFIPGIVDVSIRYPTVRFKTKSFQQGFLCKTLRHSFKSGIALTGQGRRFFSNGQDFEMKFADQEDFRADRNER